MKRRLLFLIFDLISISALILIVLGIAAYVQNSLINIESEANIKTDPHYIPQYAFFSLIRSMIGLFLSYLFAIGWGNLAMAYRRWEKGLMTCIDVLQSLPVLTFMPAFLLSMIKLFKHSKIGIECACILMIFVGQVWNLVFAYYESRKTFPKPYEDLAHLFKFSGFEKFFKFHLPYALRPLIYNGMMSMAGGWVFLMTCESFVLKNKPFQVVGLGSYLSKTFDQQMYPEFVWGLMMLVLMITGMNEILWKPLQAWIDIIYEDPSKRTKSFFFTYLQSSRLASFFKLILGQMLTTIQYGIEQSQDTFNQRIQPRLKNISEKIAYYKNPKFSFWLKGLTKNILILIMATLFLKFLPQLPRYSQFLSSISEEEWLALLDQLLKTLFRVFLSIILSLIWTLPVGILIGRNPFLRSILTPFIQNLAAFPMPALFPLIAMVCIKYNIPSSWIALALMTFANQWYILFNVLSGLSQIPRNYNQVAKLYLTHPLKKLIYFHLPVLLPSIVTGLLGASGSAWNMSILAEYVELPPDQLLWTDGIGGQITRATKTGDFPILVACVVLIVFILLLINRLVWRPLITLQERIQS